MILFLYYEIRTGRPKAASLPSILRKIRTRVQIVVFLRSTHARILWYGALAGQHLSAGVDFRAHVSAIVPQLEIPFSSVGVILQQTSESMSSSSGVHAQS